MITNREFLIFVVFFGLGILMGFFIGSFIFRKAKNSIVDEDMSFGMTSLETYFSLTSQIATLKMHNRKLIEKYERLKKHYERLQNINNL